MALRVVCAQDGCQGLQALEKYAVQAAGGSNHRFRCGDADCSSRNNHPAPSQSACHIAVERASFRVEDMVEIQVQVGPLAQLDEALALGGQVPMLDNMDR